MGGDTCYQNHSWRPCGTRPGKSFLHRLATERTSPSLAVSITTSTVTKSSGPTTCGCFTSLSRSYCGISHHLCNVYKAAAATGSCRSGRMRQEQSQMGKKLRARAIQRPWLAGGAIPRRLTGPELWTTWTPCPLQVKALGSGAWHRVFVSMPQRESRQFLLVLLRTRTHGLRLQTGSRKTKPTLRAYTHGARTKFTFILLIY